MTAGKRAASRMSLAIVLLAGCLGLLAQVLTAQQVHGGTVAASQWEYRCVQVDAEEVAEVTRQLNKEGASGWELVDAIFGGTFCFKREVVRR